jgi:hypothetical protein
MVYDYSSCPTRLCRDHFPGIALLDCIVTNEICGAERAGGAALELADEYSIRSARRVVLSCWGAYRPIGGSLSDFQDVEL